MKDYHCCATCIHFEAIKQKPSGMVYRCVRLGYETKPSYQFRCWDPKEHIVKLINKEK
ncbi:hypothetical protein [Salirhabdus salicampi]|uniref:hypothetical protein n=1 Tax=Salirhabdus salicampi TaxID=476102 RepID=UPI0020C4DE86|nr:hypothetical protein [Salirhabdus salicampi]MCP8616140.1 hypothetical protein [Salirhabdus salicampi]